MHICLIQATRDKNSMNDNENRTTKAESFEDRLTALGESEMAMFRFLLDKPAGVILTVGTDKILAQLLEREGFVLCPGRDDGKTEEISLDDDHRTALSLFGKLRRYTHLCDLFHEISGWFFCSFSSEEQSSYFTEGGAPGGHKHLNSTGSNVGNVLEFIKQSDEEEYNRIVSEIQSKIPTMKKKKNLPKALSESPDKLFLYLLLLRDGSPRSTIFIETPDKDLYHDMVDVLADEMREYSIRNHYCQIYGCSREHLSSIRVMLR